MMYTVQDCYCGKDYHPTLGCCWVSAGPAITNIFPVYMAGMMQALHAYLPLDQPDHIIFSKHLVLELRRILSPSREHKAWARNTSNPSTVTQTHSHNLESPIHQPMFFGQLDNQVEPKLTTELETQKVRCEVTLLAFCIDVFFFFLIVDWLFVCLHTDNWTNKMIHATLPNLIWYIIWYLW